MPLSFESEVERLVLVFQAVITKNLEYVAMYLDKTPPYVFGMSTM